METESELAIFYKIQTKRLNTYENTNKIPARLLKCINNYRTLII